jgi:predicted RNA binding protein YcfA (HicA-like mRNA interferase family)
MVSIPVHGKQEVPTGTLAAILREAGVSRERFMALL